MPVPETERVDAAVDEARELVDDGDRPLVAADYVAEQHDLDHRFEDILERVQEAETDG
jgi:ferritin